MPKSLARLRPLLRRAAKCISQMERRYMGAARAAQAHFGGVLAATATLGEASSGDGRSTADILRFTRRLAGQSGPAAMAVRSRGPDSRYSQLGLAVADEAHQE